MGLELTSSASFHGRFPSRKGKRRGGVVSPSLSELLRNKRAAVPRIKVRDGIHVSPEDMVVIQFNCRTTQGHSHRDYRLEHGERFLASWSKKSARKGREEKEAPVSGSTVRRPPWSSQSRSYPSIVAERPSMCGVMLAHSSSPHQQLQFARSRRPDEGKAWLHVRKLSSLSAMAHGHSRRVSRLMDAQAMPARPVPNNMRFQASLAVLLSCCPPFSTLPHLVSPESSPRVRGFY